MSCKVTRRNGRNLNTYLQVKRNKSEKPPYHTTPYTTFWKRQNYRDVTKISACQGNGGKEKKDLNK